jgi:hypothetical protein
MRPVRLAPLGIALALLFAVFAPLAWPAPAAADPLADLARDFWAWRAVHQPLSGDDIPRIERPAGWVPDWSRPTIAARREALGRFEARWRALDAAAWPVPRQVDWRLTGSAISRVRWELDYERAYRRDPNFYLEQTIGAVFDRLLAPPPFDRARSEEIVRRMESIPAVLYDAPGNLDQAVAPFARLALGRLGEVHSAINAAVAALDPLLPPDLAHRLDTAAVPAIKALESYRDWLRGRLPGFPEKTALGRDAYLFFLRNVALLPFTPEEMLSLGRQEWQRAVAFEAFERQRNRGLPDLPLLRDADAQIARESKDELAVRYAEEMMLQAGYFDDSPRTREIVYSFMRLRALRVEVDVRLALGEITLDQAAEYLRTTVPMDAETARDEAASFAATPGQAISYQLGKVQILRLLADARRQQGDAFDLRAFHDFVWKNGNVPLSLQRWELLGLRDEVDALGTPGR